MIAQMKERGLQGHTYLKVLNLKPTTYSLHPTLPLSVDLPYFIRPKMQIRVICVWRLPPSVQFWGSFSSPCSPLYWVKTGTKKGTKDRTLCCFLLSGCFRVGLPRGSSSGVSQALVLDFDGPAKLCHVYLSSHSQHCSSKQLSLPSCDLIVHPLVTICPGMSIENLKRNVKAILLRG